MIEFMEFMNIICTGFCRAALSILSGVWIDEAWNGMRGTQYIHPIETCIFRL